MYTLDTNIIIYLLKGDSSVVQFMYPILENRTVLYVATITEVELYSFQALSSEEENNINSALQTTSIILLDSHIARIAANIRRQSGIKIADSVIAATALYTGSTLLTRNVRDFKKIDGLSLQTI